MPPRNAVGKKKKELPRWKNHLNGWKRQGRKNWSKQYRTRQRTERGEIITPSRKKEIVVIVSWQKVFKLSRRAIKVLSTNCAT